MKDLVILKKKYGEKFARLCRTLFPTILEQEGQLAELMLANFEPSRSLYEDLVHNSLEYEFRDYIFSLLKTDKDYIEVQQTPEELLDKAGYTLYKCETDKDVKSFAKYYEVDEELCTFYDSYRIISHKIFFAVKKNVNEIHREDFNHPQREDEYSTSVISIQFSNTPNSYVSIKSRYNHTVENPDATFSNDLDNIIPGLTKSFAKYYYINLNRGNKEFKIPSYVKDKYNKFFKYNYCIQNVYYCENNVIIEDDEAVYYDKDRYEIIDYFILSKRSKQLICTYPDGFLNEFKDVKKIDIIKDEDSNQRIFKVYKADNTSFEFTVNKHNQITSYTNKYQEIMHNRFLMHNKTISTINVPNLKEMREYSLEHNKELMQLSCENLERIGKYCLNRNTIMEIAQLPNLKVIEDYCFTDNKDMHTLYAPALKSIGRCCFNFNNAFQELTLPSLEYVGNSFMTYNHKLNKFEAPNLKIMGNNCFAENLMLTELNLHNIEEMGDYCFYNNNKIEQLNLPKLKVIGKSCFFENNSIKELKLENLQEMHDNCFFNNNTIEDIYAPNLISMEDDCFYFNNSIKKLDFKSLQDMGKCCFLMNTTLESINTPNIIMIGNLCFKKHPDREKILASIKEQSL